MSNLDNLFNSFFNEPYFIEKSSNPSFTKKDGDYKVTFDLVGVKKEDIDTSVDGNILRLKASRKIDDEVVKEYSESYRLPSYVSTDNIQASYENGVLELTFNENTKNISKIDIQ